MTEENSANIKRLEEDEPEEDDKIETDRDEKEKNDEESDDKKNKDVDEANREKEKKAGVIYLSRIPTKLNVKLIREYMSRFGKVGRIYLEPKEKRRKNEPRSFKEGWVEFEKRRVARLVASQLNNNTVGGKRRNPWYHEIWNIKYLKHFRWTHLNERVAYEQEVRKQKLRQDIALAKKEANFYMQNFEKIHTFDSNRTNCSSLHNPEFISAFQGGLLYDKYPLRKDMTIRKSNKKDERRKRTENKKTKSNDTEEGEKAMSNQQSEGDSSMKRQTTAATDADDVDSQKYPNSKLRRFEQHPVFERKTKVAGNDDFLKQIFS